MNVVIEKPKIKWLIIISCVFLILSSLLRFFNIANQISFLRIDYFPHFWQIFVMLSIDGLLAIACIVASIFGFMWCKKPEKGFALFMISMPLLIICCIPIVLFFANVIFGGGFSGIYWLVIIDHLPTITVFWIYLRDIIIYSSVVWAVLLFIGGLVNWNFVKKHKI